MKLKTQNHCGIHDGNIGTASVICCCPVWNQ